MFEIKCHRSGDVAEAETAEDALVAADTLAHDYADAHRVQGSLRAARQSIIISENGTWSNVLTGLARQGFRALLSAEWSR